MMVCEDTDHGVRIVICEKAFSADEAIFIARIIGVKDCFVVPPRSDDFFRKSVNGNLFQGLLINFNLVMESCQLSCGYAIKLTTLLVTIKKMDDGF